MRSLLDTMVVADFQRAQRLPALAAASSAVPMAMVDEVYGELTVPPPDASPQVTGRSREALRELATGQFDMLEIHPGTPAQRLFSRLRGAATKQHDKGEAASIAIAAVMPDLLFVTGDRNGTLSALNELHSTGERVMRVPVFLKVLFASRAISAEVVRDVAQHAVSHGITPTWWDEWLATL